MVMLTPPADLPTVEVPRPEAIRAAIAAADERAEALRRLLWVSLRLHYPPTAGELSLIRESCAEST